MAEFSDTGQQNIPGACSLSGTGPYLCVKQTGSVNSKTEVTREASNSDNKYCRVRQGYLSFVWSFIVQNNSKV